MGPLTELTVRASEYAQRYQIRLGRQLGFGNNGTVWKTEARTALKVFRHREFYQRELAAYQRLRRHEVVELAGHRVPRLQEWDDELAAMEMSIVHPPFVLDFASARLDGDAIEFPEHVMEEIAERRQEAFGDRWQKVVVILCALQRMGIHMTDVHPGNIAFENPDEQD
jgi:hypothetical protein